MIMLSIVSMTVVVFLSRYLFLEPKIPLKLNYHAHRLLSYASPVVLTALWAPIVFLPEGKLSLTYSNVYLIGAIFTGLLIWKTNNVLVTIILSMGLFLVLNMGIFK